MKTPISYYGGKQQLAPMILSLIPEHKVYTESFFGGGAIFWAKEPAPFSAINDFNGNVVNFYKVLRSRLPELQKALNETLHSRETYKHAMVIYSLPWLFDELQRAWAFWVCTQTGFSHQVGSWAFDRHGKTLKMMQNKIAALTNDYADRLKSVTIETKDACEVISYFDSADAFHYVDPPYLNCDQGHYAGYTESDFERLLKTLETVKGNEGDCYASKCK